MLVVAVTVVFVGGFVRAQQPGPKVGVPVVTKEQYKPVPGTYGGRFVRATLGEPKSFNPITAGETSTTDFTDRMFQGLTVENPFTGEIEPLIAESWATSDDGLVWTFKLKKNVTFNDGSPLTAADVVFTWNSLLYDLTRPTDKAEPRWPCSMRDITTIEGKIVKVEQVDDYTVKFTTPVKIAIWDRYAGQLILSKKKYEKLVADGSFGGAMSSDSKPEDIVGSGPWMLGSYERGTRVTLKRNPNYWRKDSAGNKLPYLDELVFVVVRDLNAALLNFQQKVTDSYTVRSGKEIPLLRPKQQEENFTLYQLGPDYGTEFITFNMNLDAAKKGVIPEYKVKWFRDKRFRQACSYTIDRKGMVQNVLRNLGYPLAAPFTRAPGPFTQSDIEPYPQDLNKAKALLADMGLKDRNGDGFLEDEQGNKVAFTLVTNAGNNNREEMMDFVRKDLQRIGMDVNILPLEFNLLVDKLDNTYDWEAMIMGFTGGREPNDGANLWKSSARLHMWWPEEKTPSLDWEKRIDEIYRDTIQELDKSKRKAMFREWLQIIHEEQPLVYLTVPERVGAVRNRFGNLFPSPAPEKEALGHNEEEWFVKDAAAKAN
jgi:peptide/nickel transport system substrate-binding protein